MLIWLLGRLRGLKRLAVGGTRLTEDRGSGGSSSGWLASGAHLRKPEVPGGSAFGREVSLGAQEVLGPSELADAVVRQPEVQIEVEFDASVAPKGRAEVLRDGSRSSRVKSELGTLVKLGKDGGLQTGNVLSDSGQNRFEGKLVSRPSLLQNSGASSGNGNLDHPQLGLGSSRKQPETGRGDRVGDLGFSGNGEEGKRGLGGDLSPRSSGEAVALARQRDVLGGLETWVLQVLGVADLNARNVSRSDQPVDHAIVLKHGGLIVGSFYLVRCREEWPNTLGDYALNVPETIQASGRIQNGLAPVAVQNDGQLGFRRHAKQELLELAAKQDVVLVQPVYGGQDVPLIWVYPGIVVFGRRNFIPGPIVVEGNRLLGVYNCIVAPVGLAVCEEYDVVGVKVEMRHQGQSH
ncbi:hypothetical protein HWI79_2885 [Cryptosporidium felis]|nr:hypothetical protein HWI79_2885 [Cryptosporidium felis]